MDDHQRRHPPPSGGGRRGTRRVRARATRRRLRRGVAEVVRGAHDLVTACGRLSTPEGCRDHRGIRRAMIDVHAIDTTLIEEYDLIVLGGGAVGENVADRAVQGGLTAVIVEHELVGGECSYWACMPSKALLRSAAGAARRPPRSRRRCSRHRRPRRAGRPRPPQRVHQQLVRRRPGAVGEERRHRPGPRPRPHQRHRAVTVTDARRRHDSCSSRGTPWPWPPARPRSSPTSTGLRDVAPVDQPRGHQRHRRCPRASPSSAAAWSPPRWPPPTPRFGTHGHPDLARRAAGRHGALRRRARRRSAPRAGRRPCCSAPSRPASAAASTASPSRPRAGATISAEELLVATGRAPRTGDIGLETIGLTPGELARHRRHPARFPASTGSTPSAT